MSLQNPIALTLLAVNARKLATTPTNAPFSSATAVKLLLLTVQNRVHTCPQRYHKKAKVASRTLFAQNANKLATMPTNALNPVAAAAAHLLMLLLNSFLNHHSSSA